MGLGFRRAPLRPTTGKSRTDEQLHQGCHSRGLFYSNALTQFRHKQAARAAGPALKAALQSVECAAFGVRFRLFADSDRLLPEMLACAPLGTQQSAPGGADAQWFALLESTGSYRLVVDYEIVVQATELRPVLDRLTAALMVYVANNAPDRVFVHAGVVGWQGRALVLPGISFAGKSTLVAALVRAGATYYSDEYAVLDEQGRVHPYARDLRMRRAGSKEQAAMAVEHLGGRAGAAPLVVSHVVFAEYTASGRWNPKPVSAGIAVLEMLQHAIPVQRTPARVMATLAKMIETATVLRSERGEAHETACTLLSAMDAGRPA